MRMNEPESWESAEFYMISRLHKEGKLWHFEQKREDAFVIPSAVWLSAQPALESQVAVEKCGCYIYNNYYIII